MCFLAALILNNATVVRAETVRILFTNNSNGKLTDCNCPNDPYGGLAERVELVREYRGWYPDTLLFDSGGYLGLSTVKNKSEAVFRLMTLMEYDAWGIGDQELYHTMGRFLDITGERKEYIINASIRDENGATVFDECRVFDVNGIRIGVTGVVSDETFRFFPDDRRDFMVEPPDSSLARVLPALRGDSDCIIVLSQMGQTKDRELAGRVQGIDCIIGGHSQTLLEEPIVVDGCHIVQAGRKGGHIGELVLTFNDERKLTDISYKLLEVTKRYGIAADVRALLTDELDIDVK